MTSAKIEKLQSLTSGKKNATISFSDDEDSENEDVKSQTIEYKTGEVLYSKMDLRSHVLHRPDTYIGSINRLKSSGKIWVKGMNRFECREVYMTEGLLRIFMEIVSNAIDNIWRSKERKIQPKLIEIEIDRKTGWISVWNDGLAIPLRKFQDSKTGIVSDNWIPEQIFGELLSGSNYDDDEKRKTSGRNGIGAKGSAIMSKVFEIELFNPEYKAIYRQRWTENMSKKEPANFDKNSSHFPSGKGKSGYTLVRFSPDYERFGYPNGLDDDMMAVLEKSVYDYAMIAGTNGVSMIYNGTVIPISGLKDYVSLYYDKLPEELLQLKSEDCSVIVAPKADPLFKGDLMHVAFINGIITAKGGVHVDAWDEAIFRPIVQKINGDSSKKKKDDGKKKAVKKKKSEEKKRQTIDISHVRKYFSLFIVAEANNPRFTGQNKDVFNSPEIHTKVKASDISKLMKWSFVERIEESMKLKEFASLKDAGKKKRNYLNIPNLDDANNAGHPKLGRDCILCLTEGDSAASYVAKGMQFGLEEKIGQDKIGIFPLRGKCVSPDTPILLWDGFTKLAKDVVIGDTLIDDSGNPCKVENLTSGEDIMYEVYSEEDQVSYKVNSEHILSLKFRDHRSVKWNERRKAWVLPWFDKKKFKPASKSINVVNSELDHAIPEDKLAVRQAVQDLVDGKLQGMTMKYLAQQYGVNKGWVQAHAQHVRNKIACKCGAGMGQNQVGRSTLTKEEAYEKIMKLRDEIDDSDIMDIPIQKFLEISPFQHKLLKGFRCSGVNWPRKDVILDPYILGMWLGDGDSSGYGFTSADPELIEAWKKWGHINGGEIYLVGSSKYHYGIRATGNSATSKSHSNPLSRSLRHYNLINNKHIPADYYVNDRSTRLSVLAGLIDTDGYVGKDGRIEISQGIPNKKVADDIVLLVRSLGFRCSFREKSTSWTYKGEKRTGIAKRMCISGTGLDEIPTILPRKRCPKSSCKSDALSYVIKVRKLERGPYCGFTVSGSHRFLLGDFTVTHNCVNVRKAPISKILKNKEIMGIIRALGLEYGVDYSDAVNRNKLRYGKLYVVADSDLDGFHIIGLIANFFDTLFPSLMKTGNFFHFLRTPIVKINLKQETLTFLFYYASQKYISSRQIPNSKKAVKYFKGLGTCSLKDVSQDFGRYPVSLVHDEKSEELMLKVFGKDDTEFRKQWLLEHQDKIIERKTPDFEIEELPISNFLDDEMRLYSIDSCVRAIPCVLDGFKESSRKIICATFTRPLNYSGDELKVVQLAGYVAEKMGYHHGEQNIPDTIIGLAQSFPGSNNIPLLVAAGEFGSRQGGGPNLTVGNDAAAPRYIFTKLEILTRYIFREEDDEFLPDRIQDGEVVEKQYYMPIIPMLLVNGTSGIGTAHSTTVPQYNPLELMKWIEVWLDNKGKVKTESKGVTFYETPTLCPYYRGFSGKIEVDGSRIKIQGVMERTSKHTWTITELPLGRLNVSIKNYCEKLKKMREEGKIKSFTSQKPTLNKPYFTITADDDGIIPNLQNMKLIDSFTTTNMVLFDEKGKLIKFSSVDEILEYYCARRYAFYTIRIEGMLANLKSDLKWVNNKLRFIRVVYDKTLDISNREESELDDEMDEMKFDRKNDSRKTKSKHEEKSEENSENEGSFDYLLSMQIKCLNISSVAYKKLEKERMKLDEQIKELENTTVEELWKKEMNELKIAYDKWEKRMEKDNKVATRDRHKKKGQSPTP